MNDCEHTVGIGYDCGRGYAITEEEIKEELSNIIYDVIKDTSQLDYTIDDILKCTNCFDFYLFEYCPDCGCKLNNNAIMERLNKFVKDEITKLYNAGELKKVRKSSNKILAERQQEIGYVYLVKMGNDYKIGISKNPKTRLGEFTKLPIELEQICVEKVQGYKLVEEELHNHFIDKRKRGEWFVLNNADIEFVKNYLTERKICE